MGSMFSGGEGNQFCIAEGDDPQDLCRGGHCPSASKGQHRIDEPRVCLSVCGRTLYAPTQIYQAFGPCHKN